MTTKTLLMLLLGACLLPSGCDADTKNVDSCGDGFIDTGEECDTTVGENSCTSLGYYHEEGELRCTSDCRFDTSSCGGRCGDAIIQQDREDCEGYNLGGQTCIGLGYERGDLTCDATCNFDRSGCEDAGECGDGIIQAPEQCDGNDLDGKSCESEGYYSGNLACLMQTCQFDFSSCGGRCGDGIIDEVFQEDCDGANLDGMTCQSLEHWAGDLLCTQCRFDEASCSGLLYLAAGEGSIFAMDNFGQVFFWGRNEQGQLGDGTVVNRRRAGRFDPPTGVSFTSVSTGANHSCALDTTGTAWCWGANTDHYGQLGDGSVAGSLNPVQVQMPPGHLFVQVFSGVHLSCGLDPTGAAWCWGRNATGAIGDGSTMDRTVPTAVVMPAGRSFTRLAIGAGHVCAIDQIGALHCWGANQFGQLGDTTTVDRQVPSEAAMPEGRTFIRIASARLHTCALDDTGAPWCWGQNGSGECGVTAADLNRPTAADTPVGMPFSEISVGVGFSCAMDEVNQTVWCWGNNDTGQLGDGTTSSRATPSPVSQPGGVYFRTMSAGHYHVTAIDWNGRAWSWGYNAWGQLGDDTTTDRWSPTAARLP